MTTHVRTIAGAGAGLVAGAMLMLVAGPWALSAQDARQEASSTVVACEPSERVVVRHTVVNNQLQVATECAPAGVSAVRYQNAALTERDLRAAPVARSLAPRTSVARAQTTASRTSTEPVAKKRDWKETALIIGGSAGAGAGIGGAANGKKGALIGAAIGGGAAALVEAIRR